MEGSRKDLNKIWKPPSFEDFNVEYQCKRIRLDHGEREKKKKVEVDSVSGPSSIEELATHPRKIEELKNWFHYNTSNAPVLLITGPTGSAKTVTLRVVVSSMNMLIKEWINPVDKTDFKTNSVTLDKSEFTESRQIDKFEDFIFRSSRYKSLFDDVTKSVILVEDFPNIFLREPKLFFEFLGKYQEKGKCPIVFICTDDQNLNLSNDLFPNVIKTKYNITEIKFNPVNQSSLMKTLKKLHSKCSNKDSISMETLQSIAQNSNGDLRNAIANLEILVASSKPKKLRKPARTREKGQKSQSSSSEVVSIRDNRADFYQALGRVLYPKTIKEIGKGGANFENEKRIFVHDVTEISNSFSDSFLMLLHENYIGRFGDVESITDASDIFSICDSLLGESELREYAGLISVLGLMTSNKEPKREGFKPIKKSSAPPYAANDVWVKRFEYSHFNTTYRILNLDILPYLKILKNYKSEGRAADNPDNEDNVEIEEFDN